MTREEAKIILECMATDIIGAMAGMRETMPMLDVLRQRVDAINIALTVLTQPTQEQLEKAWKGEWLNFYNDFSTAECSRCGELIEVSPDEAPKDEVFKAFKEFYHFCPNCGAPMTDEAVKIVRKRLEGMSDINKVFHRDCDELYGMLQLIDEAPTLTPSNEWVSVEERLPEPGERVIATDGAFVGEGYMDCYGVWCRPNGMRWNMLDSEVTHWIPLPALPDRRPPEGEEDTNGH